MKSEPFDILNSELKSGVALIDSSAGTGKTYTIASIYPRLLLEGIASDVSNILVVTFTNAAADELAARIRLRLRECLKAFDAAETEKSPEPFMQYVCSFGENGKRIINRAIVAMDEAAVHTIHGFCRKALQEAAFESLMPLECEFTENEGELLQQAALDFWRQTINVSDFLIGLLQQNRLTREEFLRQYREYSNQGNCTLLPRTSPLADMLAKCAAKAGELKERFTAQAAMDIFTSLPPLSTAKANEPAKLLANPQSIAESLSSALSLNKLPLPSDVLPLTSGFLREAIKSTKEQETYQPVLLSMVTDEYMQSVNDCIPALRTEFFMHMENELSKAMKESRTLSFNDLLNRLREALQDREAGKRLADSLRHQYQAAMIDEFQDTDPVQLDIFSRIFGNARPVYYIGDPKQAIYSFRGADIFAYLRASRQADRHFTLGKNWRSESGMVAAVNAVFSLKDEPFVFNGIDFTPASAADKADSMPLEGDNGKHLQWLLLPDSEDGKPLSKDKATLQAAQITVDYIAEKLVSELKIGSRKVKPGDFAVLVRTNPQADIIKQHLQAKNIPAVVGGTGNIFQSEQFAQVELLLNFIAGNPASAALCGDFFSMSAAEAEALREDHVATGRIMQEIAQYRRLWISSGVSSMLLQLMQEKQVASRLLAGNDGERAMTNYRHIMELLADGPDNPHSLLRWLQGRKQQPSTREEELRLESDSDAVQIVTIHKSKGLEYGIVLCPFLWSTREQRGEKPVIAHVDGEELVYDCGSDKYDEHKKQMLRENLSEDLRILYVALTRAVHRCAVVWGDVKNAEYSAMGSLLATGGNLENVVSQYPELMQMFVQQEASGIGLPQPQQSDLFSQTHRIFPQPRPLQQWSASSFSSITSGHSPAPLNYDRKLQPQGIHGFGRGKGAPPANVTGTCLHAILENYDFLTVNHEMTQHLLRQFGLNSPEVHLNIPDPLQCVCNMLESVAETELPGNEAGLKMRTSDIRLNEMPFTLPVLRLDLPHDLQDVFHDHPYGSYAGAITQQQAQGFLTGIIDLVFRAGDKWYIADWKSNYLGPDNTAYTPENIAGSVYEHHYSLQYYLYTVALKRYLTLRQPGFDYTRDFGGVYYFYLRGTNAHGGGVHFELPPAGMVENLEKLFFREPAGLAGV